MVVSIDLAANQSFLTSCFCYFPCRHISISLYIDLLTGKKLPHDVNMKGVFACNELDLREVRVYGFDYDYTLACYKPSMDFLLYNLGRDRLVDKLKVSNSYFAITLIPNVNKYSISLVLLNKWINIFFTVSRRNSRSRISTWVCCERAPLWC